MPEGDSASARGPAGGETLASWRRLLRTLSNLASSRGEAPVWHSRSLEMRNRSRMAVALAIAAAILFAWLARAVASGETAGFDLAVRTMLHAAASPVLTFAMQAVTQLGSTWFVVAVGGLLVWRLAALGQSRSVWLFVTIVAGGEICDQLLKLLFQRPRPEAFFGLPEPSSYSFPSGHSVASCCFYGALATLLAARVRTPLAKGSVWLATALIVVLVGLSRVYLGVHHATDVIGGYLAGIAWQAGVRAVAARKG